MTLFTKNFQLEYLAPNEPAYLTRDVLERMTKSIDAALTRGGVAAANAADVTAVAGRTSTLESGLSALTTALNPAPTNFTLLNGARAFGAPYAPPQFSKVGSHVSVTMLLLGPVSSGAVVAALPVGCRPAGNLFILASYQDSVGTGSCAWTVNGTTGEIVAYPPASNSNTGASFTFTATH